MSTILYLKDIMKQQSISSVELAGRVGVSKTMVSYWLSGRNFPTPENLEIIARILNVPVWRLFVSPDADDSPAADNMVAFFHYKGKSHTPETLEEMMTILREWKAEEYHRICHTHDLEHMRERFATQSEIQQLLDSLCALIEGCKHSC